VLCWVFILFHVLSTGFVLYLLQEAWGGRGHYHQRRTRQITRKRISSGFLSVVLVVYIYAYLGIQIIFFTCESKQPRYNDVVCANNINNNITWIWYVHRLCTILLQFLCSPICRIVILTPSRPLPHDYTTSISFAYIGTCGVWLTEFQRKLSTYVAHF